LNLAKLKTAQAEWETLESQLQRLYSQFLDPVQNNQESDNNHSNKHAADLMKRKHVDLLVNQLQTNMEQVSLENMRQQEINQRLLEYFDDGDKKWFEFRILPIRLHKPWSSWWWWSRYTVVPSDNDAKKKDKKLNNKQESVATQEME
jgi:hypothetical protein